MKGVDATTALLAMSAAVNEFEFAAARLSAIESPGLGGPLPQLDDATCDGEGPALGVAMALGCPVRIDGAGELEHEPHAPMTVAARIAAVTRRRPAQDDVPWVPTQRTGDPATTRTAGGGRTAVHCAICGPLQLEDTTSRAEVSAQRHNATHRRQTASAAGGVR